MTDKELKKLSRTELLEMLITVTKENEDLRAEIDRVRSQLDERLITLDEVGSIAEASLKLNRVFEAAEDAAAQYIHNVMYHDQICDQLRKKAEDEAEMTLRLAKQKAAEIEETARKQAQAYWDEVSSRLDKYYEEHKDLQPYIGQ